MRIVAIAFICIVALVGCAHMDIDQNIDALSRIAPGDTQETVLQIVGQPDIRNDISEQRLILFYQTQPKESDDDPLTADLCTPVAIENGSVVTIGQDLTEQWTREAEARLRQAEIADRQRRMEESAQAAIRKAEAERQAKIEALEKKVKPIPASNAELNLKLYRQLRELDPMNPRYQKKVAFYEERLTEQEKAQKQRALRLKKERLKAAWEEGREARNVKLRQYSGNGTAEMAVHDMGNGSLYVWVKNVSRQIITTHPDYFTLLDRENHPMRCSISESLDCVLETGGISHGRIEYEKTIIPKQLIFENRESGRISKTFTID